MSRTPSIVTGKTILLVEDELAVRLFLQKQLEFDQHQVAAVGDGVEAFALFKDRCFDLVITDWMMPQMCGDQLIVEIRKLRPAQPVIMMTAMSGAPSRSELPFNKPLIKPFSFAELRVAIAEVLEQTSSMA